MTTHAQELERYRAQNKESFAMYGRAEKILPLGVSSNFRTYEPFPIYIQRAEGSKMWDVDGREYTDFSMCFGALMVGHSHPTMVKALTKAAGEGTLYGMPHDREMRAAELIGERFGLEQVRFTNSGSESTMHALRLARAYTGRDKVLKFEGAYHGGHDTVLVSVKPPKAKVGHVRHPKPLTVGHGIPDGSVENTLVAQWNDAKSVREILEKNENEVAAIILEPVMMNVGVMAPRDGFIQELRALCDEFGCLLIFDEVKTGAKLALGRRAGVVQGQGRHRLPGQGHRRRPPPRSLRGAEGDHGRDRAVPLLPRRNLRLEPAGHHGLPHGSRRHPRRPRSSPAPGLWATPSPKGTARSSRSTA